MDGHNHLDRQVRQRGECPGCDQFWARQEARLADANLRRSVIDQLDKMADRHPIRPSSPWCLAMYDEKNPHRRSGPETHTCSLPAGHQPPHHCPVCDIDW